MTKVCSKCKIDKNLNEFYRHKSSKDGVRPDCKVCSAKRHKLRYDSKNSMLLEQAAAYRNLPGMKEKAKIYAKSWREHNLDYVKSHNKRYYSQHREILCEYQREWRKNNRGKVNFYKMKRYTTKLLATPKWLSREQLEIIKTIYVNCPIGFHVDHIIPLQGKNVCGLHVPWNLQYLSAQENLSKNNSLELQTT